jgi:hypothetical protein
MRVELDQEQRNLINDATAHGDPSPTAGSSVMIAARDHNP